MEWSKLEFPSGWNERALKRYGSGYPETGKRVAGHRVPGDTVRGKVKYAANSGETMINASTTRLDFYLHALPAVHRDNSLLYDYLTGHTCGKGQVCAPILAKLSTITMLNYRSNCIFYLLRWSTTRPVSLENTCTPERIRHVSQAFLANYLNAAQTMEGTRLFKIRLEISKKETVVWNCSGWKCRCRYEKLFA